MTELLVRYSSCTVLQKKVAYLQHRGDKNLDDSDKYPTTEDLGTATSAIVKLVQNEVYQEEIGDLKKRGYGNSSSRIASLWPVLINVFWSWRPDF